MIFDYSIYVVAILAVLILGISKGGFGGGLGMIATPIIALVTDPKLAAAIILPVLCVLDLSALWVYRGKWALNHLLRLLPGAAAGLLIGSLVFRQMPGYVIQLILGLICVVFTLIHWMKPDFEHTTIAREHPGWLAPVAGTVAGFTTFIAHAGAPPFNLYMLPLRLHRTTYVATSAAFFATANYIKLVPYSVLGLLPESNLRFSATLLPAALAGFAIGTWLHKRVSDTLFYRIAYVVLFMAGLRLVYSGSSQWL